MIDITGRIISGIMCYIINFYMLSIVARAIIWGEEIYERY